MHSTSSKIHWTPLLILAGIKLCIHFASSFLTEFGLQRDEYLYINEADHLAWGYMEVPPMISIIGWVSKGLFGSTLFAVKFPPALIGALTIILIGTFVNELGGKKWAQIIAASTFLISPAFLGSNDLFQPVSFNQFCWFLSILVVIKIINAWDRSNNNIRLWVGLGIVVGSSILTKYSVVFFYAGLFAALLFTRYRDLLKTKYPYIAFAIAVAIISPNLWWQYSLDFPIVRHMEDLRATQLVNITWQSFFGGQFHSHFCCAIVWLPGLIYGLLHDDHRFRLISLSFIFTVALLFAGSGKGYYTYGAYTMLFVLGAILWERFLKDRSWIIPAFATLCNIPALPLAIPILPVDQMVSYSAYIKDEIGLKEPFRWEDGVVRSLRQDYADMLGWDELPGKVAKVYNSLSEDEKKHCLIWGGSYGHAGTLNFFREEYELPECHSFNASYVAWVPEDFHIKAQIQVEDTPLDPSPFFEQTILVDSIEHPYARDPGYIYLKRYPTQDLRAGWKEIVRQARVEAGY